MPANPFRYNNYVKPENFLGRKHLVEEIIEDLYMLPGDSYGIVGGRRFGKSSLLRAIEHQLLEDISTFACEEEDFSEKELDVLPVFVSLQSLDPDSPDDVFGLIVHRLRKAVCGKKKPIRLFSGPIVELGLPDYKEKNFDPATLQILESEIEEIVVAAIDLYEKPLRIALLIDEIDAVLDFLWTDKLLGMFRSLIIDSDIRDYVRMVFAGSGRYLQVDEKGSPLLNAIKACFLEPFDDQAVDSLMGQAGEISPDVAELVAQLGGGHPFILQYLLHHLYNEGIKDVTTENVPPETRKFLHDRSQDVENWWYAIGEDGRKTYYLLAQTSTWMTHAELIESAPKLNFDIDRGLKALCFHGLGKHDGTYKKFCISGQLFQDWALAKYQSLEEPEEDAKEATKGKVDIDQKAGPSAVQFGQLSGSSITIYQGASPEMATSFVDVNPEKVAKLRPIVEVITSKFDREEFRMLCFNIGVDYDQLNPGGLNSQAIQMVRSCDHADKLEVLIAEVKRLRPSASL